MDELTIDGKVYLSSKRAAAVTGYAKDYVGQLCREGRVEAKLVGRSWYVYEPSLNKHRFSDEEASEVKSAEKEIIAGEEGKSGEEVSEKTNIQAIFENTSYTPEEVTSLPEIHEQPAKESISAVSDMQAAWQEWFDTRVKPQDEKKASEDHSSEEVVPMHKITEQEAPKAVRRHMGDIMPGHGEPLLFRESTTISNPVEHSSGEYIEVRRTSIRKDHKQERVLSPSVGTIYRNVFIAIITLSIAFTAVATGLVERLHLSGVANIYGIKEIQGTFSVKK